MKHIVLTDDPSKMNFYKFINKTLRKIILFVIACSHNSFYKKLKIVVKSYNHDWLVRIVFNKEVYGYFIT